MTSLPPAAKRALLARRAMDHQGVTRKPKPRHCRRCGMAVIAAIDDHGLTTSVSPTPTTAKGELDARLAGLRTFTLWGGEMLYRSYWEIKGLHPDRYDVHVIHECGTPPPEINPKRIKPPIRKEDDNAPPPF